MLPTNTLMVAVGTPTDYDFSFNPVLVCILASSVGKQACISNVVRLRYHGNQKLVLSQSMSTRLSFAFFWRFLEHECRSPGIRDHRLATNKGPPPVALRRWCSSLPGPSREGSAGWGQDDVSSGPRQGLRADGGGSGRAEGEHCVRRRAGGPDFRSLDES